MDQLGERLRELRLEKGLTQVQLAVQAGTSPGLINQTERGRRTPTLPTLEKLAAALDVEVGDLFAGKAEAPSQPSLNNALEAGRPVELATRLLAGWRSYLDKLASRWWEELQTAPQRAGWSWQYATALAQEIISNATALKETLNTEVQPVLDELPKTVADMEIVQFYVVFETIDIIRQEAYDLAVAAIAEEAEAQQERARLDQLDADARRATLRLVQDRAS